MILPFLQKSGNYNRTILAEGRFGNGYLSISGEPLYLSAGLSENIKNYFLNLFSLACGEGGDQPLPPFLDLPWDYESKGMSFSDAATTIGLYFDHEYPFSDVGSALKKPIEAQNSVTNFEGEFRNLQLSYSGYDGYDWFTKAKVKNGDPVWELQYFSKQIKTTLCAEAGLVEMIMVMVVRRVIIIFRITILFPKVLQSLVL